MFNAQQLTCRSNLTYKGRANDSPSLRFSTTKSCKVFWHDRSLARSLAAHPLFRSTVRARRVYRHWLFYRGEDRFPFFFFCRQLHTRGGIVVHTLIPRCARSRYPLDTRSLPAKCACHRVARICATYTCTHIEFQEAGTLRAAVDLLIWNRVRAGTLEKRPREITLVRMRAYVSRNESS